jgi:hypothetical protein
MLFGGLCELRIADESKICTKPLRKKVKHDWVPTYKIKSNRVPVVRNKTQYGPRNAIGSCRDKLRRRGAQRRPWRGEGVAPAGAWGRWPGQGGAGRGGAALDSTWQHLPGQGGAGRGGTVLVWFDSLRRRLIRLKRIYNFWWSMLVHTPFALCFVTLHGIFMYFLKLTY